MYGFGIFDRSMLVTYARNRPRQNQQPPTRTHPEAKAPLSPASRFRSGCRNDAWLASERLGDDPVERRRGCAVEDSIIHGPISIDCHCPLPKVNAIYSQLLACRSLAFLSETLLIPPR
jgi:hypothetical protein